MSKYYKKYSAIYDSLPNINKVVVPYYSDTAEYSKNCLTAFIEINLSSVHDSKHLFARNL